jgi:hypothetical protein
MYLCVVRIFVLRRKRYLDGGWMGRWGGAWWVGEWWVVGGRWSVVGGGWWVDGVVDGWMVGHRGRPPAERLANYPTTRALLWGRRIG